MSNVSIKKSQVENFDFLKPKSELYSKFWVNGELVEEVSDHLVKIATDILKKLEFIKNILSPKLRLLTKL